VWDFDLGFGNAGFWQGWNPEGWSADTTKAEHYVWYARLFQDPDFLQRYIDRWSELRTNIFATSNILARIDKYTAQLAPAMERNFRRWPFLETRITGTQWVGKTYQEHVDHLKHWITHRLTWIDSQDFPKPVLELINHVSHREHKEGHPTRKALKMSCEAGKVYYTTDGSDPRLRGGDISPRPQEYKEPMPLDPGLRIKARVRSEYGLWSAPVVWP
jgi:CotH kinase protein/Chitobiase/beta-hexosaminidase C-terminal domain